jgi:hypothetical protein
MQQYLAVRFLVASKRAGEIGYMQYADYMQFAVCSYGYGKYGSHGMRYAECRSHIGVSSGVLMH